MATNFVWDKCHWFRSQVADSTLDDPDIITVCKQFPQQNSEVILSCQNNDTLPGEPEIKSTHLSGGSAKDKQSCSLHITEIDSAMDNGFWNVAVSGTIHKLRKQLCLGGSPENGCFCLLSALLLFCYGARG